MPVELEYDYMQATAAMDKFSQDDINELKAWTEKLDKSKYVPKDLSDKQLVLFYNACYGDMDKTKACIEKYYMCKKNGPELFDNRYFNTDIFRKTEETLEFSILPGKSCEGYDIIYHRLHDTDPANYNLEAGIKMLFMTVEACLSERGPQPGHILLFDMRGVRFGHLTKISLSALRKFFVFVQEAMPVRMRAVHVLNTEPVLDKLMLIIRPFMDKKFYDILKFHHKNEDLEKFYSTVIPRAALPADHGGALQDTRALHAACMRTLRRLEPYYRAEQAQRDAARALARPASAASAASAAAPVASAFKALEID